MQCQQLPATHKQLVYDSARAAQIHLQRAFPSSIIYIDTPPGLCLERIQKRGRENETTVSIDYLQTLAHKYEAALAAFPGRKVRIDGTLPPDEVAADVARAVRELTALPRPAYSVFLPRDQGQHPLAEPELFARTDMHEYWPTTTQVHMYTCNASAGSHLVRGEGSISFSQDDWELNVPILFQQGPGRFHYSKDFVRQYRAWSGEVPSEDYRGRFDNWMAARVYCALGCDASSGPGSRIRLALVPRRAGPGIYIFTDSHSGAERVGIDVPRYVQIRIQEREANIMAPTDPRRRQIWEYDMAQARRQMATGYTDEANRLAERIVILPNDNQPGGEPNLVFMVSNDSGPSISEDLKCVMCNSPHDEANMLLCSGCNRGFHTYCAALSHVPEGDWFCGRCKRADKQKMRRLRAADTRRNPPPAAEQEQESDDSDFNPGSDEQEPNSDGDGDTDTEQGEPIPDIYDDPGVIHYLKNQELPDSAANGGSEGNKKEAKRIRRRAQGYTARSGQIYKTATDRHPHERLVPPKEQRQRIIDEIHADLGHLGIAKVCNLIAKKYYWRRMTQDVKAQLKDCDSCQKRNAKFNREAPELRPWPIEGLFDRVSFDYMGPFPKTQRGNKFILLGIDSWSRWLEGRATKRRDAATSTQFLVEEFIARGATPKTVLTDHGSEFMSSFDECLKSNGVEHRRSAPNRPSTNGLCERAVQNVLHALQKTVGDYPETWDEHLPFVLLGLRSARQDSTGFSPAMLAQCRELTLPVDRRLAADLAGPSALAATPTGLVSRSRPSLV